MMATKDKSQDEKNLKTLRELAGLPANRHCFDCQQRGPTYIDVTVGSFVCTSCSGMLRGLNPPHRVKSITMASFTPEEMEEIKSKGNEYCKQVWLGKYDPSQSLESEYQNLQKIKDFMIQKYEDKKYYVDPEFAVKKPKPRAPAVPANTVHTSRSQTALVETKAQNQLIQKSPWSSQDFQSGDLNSKDADLFRETSHDPFRQTTCQAALLRTSTRIDALLEDLYRETALKRERILAAYYGWPWYQEHLTKREGMIPAHSGWHSFDKNMQGNVFQSHYEWPYAPTESSSFADFGSAFGKASDVSGQFGSPVNVSSSSGLSTAQSTATTTAAATTKPSQKKPAPPPPDRYAALADLDNQLHQQQQQQQQTLISSVVPPTSNVSPFWASNAPSGYGPVNYDAAVQNPFGHGLSPWAPQPTMVAAPPPGNPFQSISTQAMTKPVQMPMPNIANGVLNGNVADHHNHQNGTAASNSFWARTTANQPWCPAQTQQSPFQNHEQDSFSIKSAVPVDRCNPWTSTVVNESANPFSNADKVTTTNIPQKNATNNPFL